MIFPTIRTTPNPSPLLMMNYFIEKSKAIIKEAFLNSHLAHRLWYSHLFLTLCASWWKVCFYSSTKLIHLLEYFFSISSTTLLHQLLWLPPMPNLCKYFSSLSQTLLNLSPFLAFFQENGLENTSILFPGLSFPKISQKVQKQAKQVFKVKERIYTFLGKGI